jgi:hypothetical protein
MLEIKRPSGEKWIVIENNNDAVQVLKATGK